MSAAVRQVTATLAVPATPVSLNRLGMRGNPRTAHRMKKKWELDLGLLLLEQRFPKRLARVEASAVLRFPTRRRRDAGNHGWILDKALGDALVSGGWIPDDQPAYYRWFGVDFDSEIGPARTTITLIGRRPADRLPAPTQTTTTRAGLVTS